LIYSEIQSAAHEESSLAYEQGSKPDEEGELEYVFS